MCASTHAFLLMALIQIAHHFVGKQLCVCVFVCACLSVSACVSVSSRWRHVPFWIANFSRRLSAPPPPPPPSGGGGSSSSSLVA